MGRPSLVKRSRLKRWSLRIGGGLMLVFVAAVIGVYARSEYLLRRSWDAPQHALAVPVDAASIAEGRRLARIRGCNGGCHGEDGVGGQVFVDDPGLGRLIAPNLTEVAHRYTNGQLERAIRHGIKPDGSGVYVMPSDMLSHLDDKDLGAIIAFLRAEPATATTLPETRVGLIWRLGLVLGSPMTATATARIDQHAEHPTPEDRRSLLDTGRYIAMSTCTECHAQDLRGQLGDTPSLAVVAAYSLDDFTRLMRTGIALGNRELNEMMTGVALGRTAYLTDDEIAALHAYLQTLPDDTPGAE